MKVKFIEAVENTKFNWGKFMLCRFEQEEWAQRSALDGSGFLRGRGWSPQHLLIIDMQTGEGAIFKHGGYAPSDLNDKHQIWVCPMFEPFLKWLYKQDVSDLDALPAL